MKFNNIWRGAIVLCLLAGLLVLSFSNFRSTSVVAAEQENPLQQITVSGEGVVQLKADTVILTLGVQTDGTTAEEAQSKNADDMNVVIAALDRLLGPTDKWETYSLSLYPQYDYSEEGNGKLIGFRAENSIMVTLHDINRAGEVIDGCIRSGANVVSGIQFTLSNSDQVRLEAIKLAMKNAKSKAEAALSVEGKKIAEVANVTVTDGYYPPVYKLETYARPAAGGTPIEAATLEVRMNVSVTYNF